jgi:hypothetical protein
MRRSSEARAYAITESVRRDNEQNVRESNDRLKAESPQLQGAAILIGLAALAGWAAAQ